LAAKSNWDFLPNLPFLPILLNVLIVAFSLVVSTVGVVGSWDGCLVGWLFTRQVQEKKDVRTSLCNCGTLRRCVKASSGPRQRHAMPCIDAVVNGIDRETRTRGHGSVEADWSDDGKSSPKLTENKF
jgi:hypothetical protein